MRRSRVATHRAGAESATVKLGNGWTVRTLGNAVPGGMPQKSSALALLIAGIALSLLTGVLMFVLGTGRSRTWALSTSRPTSCVTRLSTMR